MTTNWEALPFNREQLETYLSSLYQEMVEVIRVSELQGNDESDRIKGYGYGVPLLIECLVNGVQANWCSKYLPQWFWSRAPLRPCS